MTERKNIKRHLTVMSKLALIAQSQPVVFRVRIICAVVWNRDIIALGRNRQKSHPFQVRYFKYQRHEDAIYLHAEIEAICNALKILSTEQMKSASLYICRVKRDGTWAIAKPCAGCTQAITQFDIKDVYFTREHREYDKL